jgi:hypothetical protein
MAEIAQQARSPKPKSVNTIYTALLAISFIAVIASAALVVFKCFSQYGSLFPIP